MQTAVCVCWWMFSVSSVEGFSLYPPPPTLISSLFTEAETNKGEKRKRDPEDDEDDDDEDDDWEQNLREPTALPSFYPTPPCTNLNIRPPTTCTAFVIHIIQALHSFYGKTVLMGGAAPPPSNFYFNFFITLQGTGSHLTPSTSPPQPPGYQAARHSAFHIFHVSTSCILV